MKSNSKSRLKTGILSIFMLGAMLAPQIIQSTWALSVWAVEAAAVTEATY